MEIEGVEQQILLQPEMAIVGAVYSVNGYTGHVVLTTSDLENTSDYQTSTDVATLISAHNTSEEAHPYIQALISAKQDPIVAGNGISITGGNTIAIDTTVVATQQNLATEVTNRENADIALQSQIDAISASSDVVDIVGTYQELQNYDTQHLKDNDIIKVLQDSTHGNATTYYRWSTTTQTFTLIGQEGPYYTKAGADAQFVPQTRTVNGKALSANITLTASDVSALGSSDVVQTTGTSTSQVMSQNAVTTALATKLDSADVPAGFFDGPATTSPTPATSVELSNVIKLSELQLLGDTAQHTTTGKNLLPPVNNFEVEVADVNIKYVDGVYTINGTSTGSGAQTSPWTTPIASYTIKSGDYWHYKNDFTATQLLIQVRFTDNTAFAQPIPSIDTIIDLTNYVGKTIQDMRVYFQSGNSFNGTISPMIVNNVSTSTAYEPYTDGPSPNPDYPQTVEVVTGTQTVTVTGKNLFDRANAEENKLLAWATGLPANEAGSLVSDYIPVTPSEELRFTFYAQVLFYGPSKNYIGALQTDGVSVLPSGGSAVNKITVPSLSDIAYMRLGFRASYSSSINLLTANIQVEKGGVATTYEPYQGHTYTVELGSTELCKIGNYQDYIYQGSDGWYVHKETNRVEFNGSESWTMFSGGDGTFYIAKADIITSDIDTVSNIKSNYYEAQTFRNLYNRTVDYGIANHNAQHWIAIRNKDCSDANSFKTWLASNNTTVYYVLATPTDTKITDISLINQLNELLNATLYQPNTTISSTGTMPTILGITAYTGNLSGIIEFIKNQ